MGIAVFGGSFDPVHVGHLWIAEAARTTLPVDHVRWFPAATSPLKPHGPTATNEQRLMMLKLAVSGVDGHVIDDWELRRDGVSYSVDTLRHLRDRFPNRPLFLVLGADSLASWDRWKEPAEILTLATPAVISRGGEPQPDYSVLAPFADAARVEAIRRHQIAMPTIEISSQDLRDRIAAGRSIRFLTPHPVATMIQADRLYRNDAPPTQSATSDHP